MIAAGLGMMLFLIITASTPWVHNIIDTPMQLIGRHWLLYAALAIINLSQVCAF